MKIKICGINKAEYAIQANNAGSDYIGLLIGITHVAEDKISVEEAEQIIKQSKIDIQKFVMVTHLLDANEIISILKRLSIQNLQLHDAISLEEIKKIRQALPSLFIIKAVHVLDETAIDEVIKIEEYVDAIILDSRTETRLGGTGNTHDWNISAKICQVCKKPVFLAGGLNPDNVAEAIKVVMPYAVDVNSGVEDENGNKDESKIILFVKNATLLGD